MIDGIKKEIPESELPNIIKKIFAESLFV